MIHTANSKPIFNFCIVNYIIAYIIVLLASLLGIIMRG